MKKISLSIAAVLLLPLMLLADPPVVSPDRVEVEERDGFMFSVKPGKGNEAKKIVSTQLDEKKFNFFETSRPGTFFIQPRRGVTGTYVVQFWHEGDTIVLPKEPPLPPLPIATLTIQVGAPTPTPTPTPTPDPKPDPKVIPTTVLSILIVEESSARSKLPAGKLQAMFAESVDVYVKSKNGTIRIFDKDDNVGMEPAFYRAAFALAKDKTLPWMIISNGRRQYEGPVPDSDSEMLNLLRQYGE